MNTPVMTDGLSKRFRSAEAVNGLTLEVPEGSVFGLVGPNGAGKPTTIKLLMNIHEPTAGHAELFGVNSWRLSVRELQHSNAISPRS